MISMTGFGRKEITTKLGAIVIEAKSENHRYLEINYQIPDSLSHLENKIQDSVKKYISRGKLRISIMAKLNNSNSSLSLMLAKETLKSLNKLKKDLRLNGETSLDQLLMMKELFTKETKEEFSGNELVKISKGLNEVILRVYKARKEEGRYLKQDLAKRTLKIEKLISKIKKKRENFSSDNKIKLKNRITNLLDDTQLDNSRLLQEIAILAERSDFTEELVRLNAHIKRFKETMNKSGTIGRELDFLIQEMNRESGTISAMAKDAKISHLTIELRSDLEKMREQIQNIQ